MDNSFHQKTDATILELFAEADEKMYQKNKI